jgi:Protein of unknown function (DUF3224)
MHTICTFEIKSWDEQPFAEGAGQPKLTHTVATKTFTGDIEGEATVAYLMVYKPDGSTSITGLERVVGRVGGREGSFVFRHEGQDKDGAAAITCTVVPGSGTGELAGLRGEGRFEAKAMTVELTFDYELS